MGMNPIEFLNEYISSSIRDIQKENARREWRKHALTPDGKRNWQYTDPTKPYYVNIGQKASSRWQYTDPEKPYYAYYRTSFEDPTRPYYAYPEKPQNSRSADNYMSVKQKPVLPQETLKARASEGYNNWLKNSTQFQLHGRKYRWAKANDNLPMNNLYGDSEAERLAMTSLIEQKRRLSNGNYIPIPM